MKLEQAVKILRKCDSAVDDCDECPIGKEQSIEVGDLFELKVTVCGLLQQAETLLEGMRE